MKRPWARPLVPLYRTALAAKNSLYARDLVKTTPLRRPVLSVGSLSAGGAGKTPLVLALAHLLARHGIAADVLSRGYGRGSSATERVDPAGAASRFGDEPLELAREGLEVVVGADRQAAGRLAEETGTAALHLLDDGFQHRRLARALDIVLLTLEDTADHLLPAGNLREPLSSLGRAHVIVVRQSEAEELSPVLALYPQAELWLIERRLELPPAPPSRPVVFCALARPESFLAMLGRAGVTPAEIVLRRDHHAWSGSDIAALGRAAVDSRADGFLTTAKDAVKITEAARRTLNLTAPLSVAHLRVALLDEAQALTTVRRVLR